MGAANRPVPTTLWMRLLTCSAENRSASLVGLLNKRLSASLLRPRALLLPLPGVPAVPSVARRWRPGAVPAAAPPRPLPVLVGLSRPLSRPLPPEPVGGCEGQAQTLIGGAS